MPEYQTLCELKKLNKKLAAIESLLQRLPDVQMEQEATRAPFNGGRTSPKAITERELENLRKLLS